jgi:hypothetical protein
MAPPLQGISVPLPAGRGYCTACAADVVLDDRGRCSCGLLAIWPSDRARPPIRTERLVALHEGPPSHGTRRLPLNVRQRRAATR